MKNFILFIILTFFLVKPFTIRAQKMYSREKATLHQLGIEVDSLLNLDHSQANRIISIWDSLYDIGKKQQINNVLSDSIWIQLLQQELKWTVKNNLKKTNTRLKYYVAHIYHSQKQFSKSIPICIELLSLQQYLTKLQIKKTYTKLERAYVLTNQLNKALSIRKQRMKLKYTESSYDLYQDFELYELALKEFLWFEKIENYRSIVDKYKYYKIIGNLYFDLGKIDSARKFYTIGLNLCNDNLNDPSQISKKNLHLNGKTSFIGLLGRCFLNEANYSKAIEYLLIDIKNSEEDINNKLFKMIHLTNAYIGNKDILNAKKYIQKIEELTKDKEDKRIALRVTKMKANYFILIKNLDSAIYYTNKHNSLKDIYNEIITRNQAILLLSNIEAEARKKDLLITKATLDKERADKKAQQVLLWASIIVIIMGTISLIILSISKKVIESKNRENELLLKELHHRVKNNLQVIYSLINLQKRRLESPELHQSLSMVQNRIKTMSLVHQNLHENDNFKEVNLESYIKTISDYLKSLYLNEEKEIIIQLDIDSSIELNMDKAITIGLLINEILSNSLKYAFNGRKEGCIYIDAQKLHSGIQLKIQDNGIGFIPEKLNSKSLGLYLIENLVKQIQGRYELENLEGTTYLIYFNA